MRRGRPPGTTRESQLTPRAKVALRAVLAGAKHAEAAEAAGIHTAYVSMLKNGEKGQEYIAKMSEDLDLALRENTTTALAELGREAINRLATLMRFSDNEAIVFKASQDLADRAPATQKIQRHRVEPFSIDPKDAKAIAATMVEAARLRGMFGDAVEGDYIQIPSDITRLEEST